MDEGSESTEGVGALLGRIVSVLEVVVLVVSVWNVLGLLVALAFGRMFKG